MTPDEKKFTILQLAIAGLTLFLTPLFSGFVVSYQISKEQSQWTEQRAFERSEAYLDRRLQLLEDVNARALKLDVSALEIRGKNASIVSNVALALKKPGDIARYSKQMGEDLRVLTEQTLKYGNDIADLSSRLQIAVLYFDPSVGVSSSELLEALQRNITVAHHEKLMSLPSAPPADAIAFVSKTFDEALVGSRDDVSRARVRLIERMRDEIKRQHDALYGAVKGVP